MIVAAATRATEAARRAPEAPPRAPYGREALRARIFLRSVLPMLEVVAAERPEVVGPFATTTAQVEIRAGSAEAPAIAAHLSFADGALAVRPGRATSPAVTLAFADLGRCNAFFAGRLVLPRVGGLVRHPILALRVLKLLSALRIIAPDVPCRDEADRALRVRLLLFMASHALSQLNVGGDPEMAALVDGSPERVYQWSVEDAGIGAWLRMRDGRTRAGRGTYGRRRPFVHFRFPTVAGAFRVLAEGGSQVEAVARGDIRTEGAPEYSRKIGVQMQRLDALLLDG